MKGIYYFNGKDITMNMCIQIRDVTSSRKGAIFPFQMQPLPFTSLRPIRLCRIPKIRFGQSRRDISRTGSMKNRSKKNCSQTKFLYTMFQRELPYNRGSSFF